ncbi:MAG: tartrate-resistant acid phosphatase type 5 family protein [Cytophagaceae bacterium]|nr:tartrate-resistant acid phosphatase type 5 family protein [Cytophagaceae bacterium]
MISSFKTDRPSRLRTPVVYAWMCVGIAIVFLSSCQRKDVNSVSDSTLRFQIIGDWGTDSPEQRAVATRLNAQAEADGSQFTLSVGDHFYPNGVSSATDSRWQSSFLDVYAGYVTRRDWFAILGNHDYYGNAQAQIDYAARSSIWRMPARYYSFTKALDDREVLFVCLDTNPFAAEFAGGKSPDVTKQDGPRQLRWADSVLTASRATWKIVLGHHPIYSAGFHGDTPDLKRLLLPILKKHKVTAYLCGHEHDLQHIEQEGIHFVVSGAGGQTRLGGDNRPVAFQEKQKAGYAFMTLSTDTLRCKFYDAGGNVLHRFTQVRK